MERRYICEQDKRMKGEGDLIRKRKERREG
jgi:hypothetical protein